ncbi:hypothetical protein B0T25DRAFT_464790 [Lasiosphaeria hispida]|uniref:RING-type domain-containing protein n=1 Tax=Lasiosphaeria hispida TaxID=260671 RepID=A0AAJ0M8I0_9PEZI|nr:hypothetical protein B0T25DRAFT_464790 [Lasiosphaeria hispida]
MTRNEAERRPRPPDSPGTSKGTRPPHNTLAAFFGSGSSTNPAKKRRLSGDRDRDRDLKERPRGWDREPDRSRNKTRDRDYDQDQHQDKKHRRRHDRGREQEEDSHRQRHSHPRSSRERLIVEVELKCLDDRYFNLKFGVKPGSPVSRLETYIRRRYEDRARPINPLAHFTFYSEGGILPLDHEITQDSQTIWYRMSRQPGELEEWKFTHWQDDTHGRLDSNLSKRLVDAIEAGATVAQLRTQVADYMGIEDPHRVVLTARGGTRSGLLQGSCWEVRQIKKWLCRWISIDVHPENGYVVIQGLGREYVYHPDLSYCEQGLELKAIKAYMRTRVFRAVRQHGKSEFDTTWSKIALSHDGKCLGSFTPVQWGATYMFELPDDAAETFSDEETWLLAPTETCTVCIDDKKISELPARVTAGCKHKPTICKDCLKQWLESSLESGSWDRLKCPDCSEILSHSEVRRFASRETFNRYDVLSTRAALKDIPNFRWCLSTTCESGQIHDDKCTKFKCVACPARHCIKHEVLWHKDETCEEYDRRNKQRKKDERASEIMIKDTSKKCPKCKKDVHKYEGCNHITCVCGHEWCYVCSAPFQRTEHGFLFCRHNAGCTERDPFIDLIDHPNGGQNGVVNGVPLLGVPNNTPRPAPLRPHAGLQPALHFVPPHLRRPFQNANGGHGGPNNRQARQMVPPPPGFPFPGPFDWPRNGGNRPQIPPLRPNIPPGATAAMTAAAANIANRVVQDGLQQNLRDPAELLERLRGLRL